MRPNGLPVRCGNQFARIFSSGCSAASELHHGVTFLAIAAAPEVHGDISIRTDVHGTSSPEISGAGRRCSRPELVPGAWVRFNDRTGCQELVVIEDKGPVHVGKFDQSPFPPQCLPIPSNRQISQRGCDHRLAGFHPRFHAHIRPPAREDNALPIQNVTMDLVFRIIDEQGASSPKTQVKNDFEEIGNHGGAAEAMGEAVGEGRRIVEFPFPPAPCCQQSVPIHEDEIALGRQVGTQFVRCQDTVDRMEKLRIELGRIGIRICDHSTAPYSIR